MTCIRCRTLRQRAAPAQASAAPATRPAARMPSRRRPACWFTPGSLKWARTGGPGSATSAARSRAMVAQRTPLSVLMRSAKARAKAPLACQTSLSERARARPVHTATRSSTWSRGSAPAARTSAAQQWATNARQCVAAGHPSASLQNGARTAPARPSPAAGAHGTQASALPPRPEHQPAAPPRAGPPTAAGQLAVGVREVDVEPKQTHDALDAGTDRATRRRSATVSGANGGKGGRVSSGAPTPNKKRRPATLRTRWPATRCARLACTPEYQPARGPPPPAMAARPPPRTPSGRDDGPRPPSRPHRRPATARCVARRSPGRPARPAPPPAGPAGPEGRHLGPSARPKPSRPAPHLVRWRRAAPTASGSSRATTATAAATKPDGAPRVPPRPAAAHPAPAAATKPQPELHRLGASWRQRPRSPPTRRPGGASGPPTGPRAGPPGPRLAAAPAAPPAATPEAAARHQPARRPNALHGPAT